MSFTRWFRELRGKSNGKEENSSKNVKTKDERRIKLNRTNSALPGNFKFLEGDSSEDGKTKADKKIKELDKRRYSFNGGSSVKVSRNPRNCLVDDRRSNRKSQTDEFQSYHCRRIVESASVGRCKEQQAMLGDELRKTRSPFDHKHAVALHSSSPKGLCANFKDYNDSGTAVKNFDIRNCNPTSSQSPIPPLPPLRGSSSLLASRYISSVGHEKYPSWPSCDPSPCLASKPKTWSVEEQLQNGNYGKDRLSAKQQISQLKTVIEKCEPSNGADLFEAKVIDDEARSREKVYMRHVECERIFADDDDNAPCSPDRDISLAKSGPHLNNTFHQYSHSHQDSSYMSQDGDYAECYVDEGRTLLTKAELEQYTKDYEENIIKTSHQKQPSYAQSEGYHSYVSSNDSAIITPLIDRLRRENDVIVSAEENIVADRESSASSGSSSDTLKWHGSLSDVSVASSSYRGSNSQHIVHSARVQTPQRHHSESVLYLGASGTLSVATQSQQWPEKVQKNNQMNSQLRKLYPVNTYSVQPQPVSLMNASNLNDNSPTSPKLTVAERISALERQQQNQNNQTTKYIYFDPEKKHKVSGQDLKVMQKKALLLYYERHHSSWRSEPQLSPIPSPPQPPPPRPRLPTPTSRRSSSASDYQDSINKENCNDDKDVTNGMSEYIYQNESRVHSHYSSSCGSLSTSEVGPMIVGAPISVDDWVPELPPKKAHLRAAFAPRHIPSPDLPPPSPPPVVDDEVFISDEPLPPPPPEIAPPLSSKSKETSKLISSACDNKRSTPPDLVLSSTTARVPTREEDNNQKTIVNPSLSLNKPNNFSSVSDKNVVKRTPSKTSNSKKAEFLKYSPQLYKEENCTAEAKSQSESDNKSSQQRSTDSFLRPSVIRNDMVRTQNSEFLKKRSVFADGLSERQSLRYSSTQKLQVNGKLTSSRGSIQNSIFETTPANKRYERNIVRTSPFGFENQSKKTDKMNKNAQFSSAVLRHSEKFPPKLDPHCPPTTYQLSQSSYRREPRDREKGLPNFEGSYKRTMSPSPSCTNLTNGFMNGSTHVGCPKDIENLDPKTRTFTETLSTSKAKFETRHHSNNAFPPVASVPAVAATVIFAAATLPASQSSTYQDRDSRIDDNSPTPVREKSSSPVTTTQTSTMSVSGCCEYSSKTLPKNRTGGVDSDIATVVANTEPKQRSCRTPRTQSDPSNVKESSLSSSNTLLSSQSSTSSLNLQKASGVESPLTAVVGIPRSQSDLSNVGSTESGYSSLSLNVPSPSVSPTRLSSSSSSMGGERNNNSVTSWSCTGIQCDIVNVTTSSSSSLTSHHERCNSEDTAIAFEDDSFKYPQKSEIVLRINATTSDAASQTEFVAGDTTKCDKLANGLAGLSLSRDRSTSPIFRQKSQEEIDCEELSRDLVSHLSSNDYLYRVLTPKPNVKKWTDYLTNLFKTTVTPFTEYSSSVTQSEDTRLIDRSIINKELSYQSESVCLLKQNDICDKTPHVQPLTMIELRQKKETLINRLDHRINCLKAEQAAVMEESRINDRLGETISEKVAEMVSAQEAAKYKLHIEEIGHITSLLLGLSGRLAKVENSLQELTSDDQMEKKALENKKNKLVSQLEEAKMLKKNIDKRSYAVSGILVKHFSDEEIAQYEYFVHMKSKLLIESREISEKIQFGEQQLNALKDTVEDGKF